MLLYFVKIFSIGFILFLFLGCENSKNAQQSANPSSLTLQSVALQKTDIYPNSIQDATLNIYSPKNRSQENNDSTLLFFFALTDENEDNSTIWFDSYALNELKSGSHSYTVPLSFPSDLNASLYTLEVKMSNSKELLGDINTTSFNVQKDDNKPQLEILGLTVNLDHTLDDELDGLSSYELNSSATTNIIASKKLSIPLLEGNETLDINSFITLRSNIADAKNVKISGCMEIGTDCIDIPISQIIDGNTSSTSDAEEDNNGTKQKYIPTYTKAVKLAILPANEAEDISLDFHIDKAYLQPFINSTVALLRQQPNAVLHEKIIVTVTSDNLSSLSKVSETRFSYPLEFTLSDDLLKYLLALPSNSSARAPSRSTSNSHGCGLKELSYKKEYRKEKYGDKFGASAYLLGKAWLDAQGIHSKVYSSIRIKRLSHTKYRILRTNITTDLEPGSFEDTGYDIEISSLGKVIYTKSYSMADKIGLSTPKVSLTTEEKKKISNKSFQTSDSNTTDSNTSLITGATVTTNATLLRQKRIKAVKDKLKKYTTSSTKSSLISYEKSFRIGKNIERKQTIMFAIIPVVISAGAEASVGYDMSVRLNGITSVTAMMEPNAYIGAYMQAGVGVGVSCCWVDIDYSAGVGGELWLLSERFTSKITASLDLVENGDYIVQLDGNLHENITNYINTMSGKIYAYATYYGPYNFTKPTDSDWRNRTKRKYFANWKGGRYKRILLNKHQTLFSIPLADECK